MPGLVAFFLTGAYLSWWTAIRLTSLTRLGSMHMSLLKDLQIILDWGTKNPLQLNTSKTQSCSLSHKKSTNIHPIFMNGISLQNKDHSILLMLLSNMILAGTDTLLQLPHKLLKSLDFSFELESMSRILLSRLGSGTTVDT